MIKKSFSVYIVVDSMRENKRALTDERLERAIYGVCSLEWRDGELRLFWISKCTGESGAFWVIVYPALPFAWKIVGLARSLLHTYRHTNSRIYCIPLKGYYVCKPSWASWNFAQLIRKRILQQQEQHYVNTGKSFGW